MLGERVWVGGCAHGTALVRTDASDDAEVITDAFRANLVTVGGDAAGHRRLRGCVGVRWRMPVSSTFMDRSASQELESAYMKDGANT